MSYTPVLNQSQINETIRQFSYEIKKHSGCQSIDCKIKRFICL